MVDSQTRALFLSGRLGYGLLDLGFAPYENKQIWIQIDAVRPIHKPSKDRVFLVTVSERLGNTLEGWVLYGIKY